MNKTDEMDFEEIKREKIMDECRDTPFDDWFYDHKKALAQDYVEDNDDDFMEFARQRFKEEN